MVVRTPLGFLASTPRHGSLAGGATVLSFDDLVDILCISLILFHHCSCIYSETLYFVLPCDKIEVYTVCSHGACILNVDTACYGNRMSSA